MAPTGKLEADFSSFKAEVDRAVVSLRGFEQESEKVGTALSRMADRYSGTKIIEKGLEINRLFKTTQDLALLTEKELAEVGRTAAEAADKMGRLGLAVPDNLKKIATEAGKATTQTHDLRGAFGQFDRVLASVGINISSEVGAVAELSDAFSKTTSELGLLGQAGLAAGVGIASFKLTSTILEVTGLNAQIAKLIDNLNGLPLEEKGAALDEMARAGQNAARMLGGAAVTINDLTVARKINAEAVRLHSLEVVTSEKVIAEWHAEIAAVIQRGELVQFTTDLESHAFTMDEVSKRYAVSVGALQQFQREQEDAAAAAKKLSDEQIRDADAYAKAATAAAKVIEDFEIKTHALAMKNEKEIRDERQKTLEDRNSQVIAGLNQIQKLEAENTDFVQKKTLSETEYKIAKIDEWARAEIAAFKGTEEELARFTEQVKIRANQQKESLQEVIPIVTLIGKSAAEAEAERARAAKQTGDGIVSEYQRQAAAFEQFKGVVVAGTSELVVTSEALRNVMQKTMTSMSDYIERDFQMQQAQRDRGEFFLPGMSTHPQPGLTGWNFRAAGGPVSAGQSYVVGERGPELFRPSSSGAIIPNAGGPTVNNTIYVNGSIRDIAPQLVAELTRLMKQTRQWPTA